MADETETQPPMNAKKLFQRAIDGLATLLGVGVMLAAGLILWEDGPLSSALALFVAGLVLLPRTIGDRPQFSAWSSARPAKFGGGTSQRSWTVVF